MRPDAQFATAAGDYSQSAKDAFAASGESDYDRFLKLWPQRLIDELARHAKKCFGKDIIALRWCMGAFGSGWCSSHDMWEFLNSKYVDGLVPQAGYSSRAPGAPLGVKIPFSSFHAHGKLLVCEHDLYPWIIRDPRRPPYHDRMVSRAKNPDEWSTINRKTAGAMIARNMGWWYFDMSGGFLSVHGLWDRNIDFALPFTCRVVNVKSGQEERVYDGKFRIAVKKGETCWFRLLP